MANKTIETEHSVLGFLAAVDEKRRADVTWLREMMEEVSGYPAKMWGKSIVGFGRYQYTYSSGRQGEMMRVGFSPRKANIALYLLLGFEQAKEQLDSLGTYKTGKSCLYIKRLSDVNPKVLTELVRRSLEVMNQRYPVEGQEGG